MLIREEVLFFRDKYLARVNSHLEVEAILKSYLDLKVKYEEFLTWQSLFDTSDVKRVITTTNESFKNYVVLSVR